MRFVAAGWASSDLEQLLVRRAAAKKRGRIFFMPEDIEKAPNQVARGFSASEMFPLNA
jgi:hypothetical protein